MKFIKRPMPVDVTFAPSAGEIKTLEGVVRYERGDALMTGIEDEHWPISRGKFESSYIPLGNIQMGEDGRYQKKPMLVDARQTTAEEMISLDGKRGELQAKTGDWIVTAPDGAQWIVAQTIFAETYQPVEEAVSQN